VLLLGKELLPLLDFESIGATIGLKGHVRQSDQEVAARKCKSSPIVFAEDSKVISEMIRNALAEEGYTHVTGFCDGHDAWQHLVSVAAEIQTAEELPSRVACLVTDVEMPRIDGLSLTRRVRDNPRLKNLPVIVFSSLVSRDNEKKGRQVGASAQVSKPNYQELLQTVERLLGQ
jgi:two-component system chemotaxis response regulator CheV